MAQLKFNAGAVEPSKPMGIIPSGKYLAEVIESDVKPTSSKDGTKLELVFKILAPAEFAGRKVWESINVVNPSAEAQRIGQADLSALCRSVGIIGEMDRTEELHGKPFCLGVKIEKGTEQYPNDRNRTSGYEAADKFKGGSTVPGMALDSNASAANAAAAAVGWAADQQAAPPAPAAQADTPKAQAPKPPAPPTPPAPPAAAPAWKSWQKSPDGFYALDPAKNDWVLLRDLEAQGAGTQVGVAGGGIEGPWNA